MPSRTVRLLLALLTTVLLLAGCGGSGGDGGNDAPNEPTPTVAVAITPATVTLAPSANRTFSTTVSGTTDTRVTWTASRGTITAAGVFTAPSTTGTVTVRATSVADSSKFAAANVSVRTGVTRAITITPVDASLVAGATQQFTVTTTGFSNSAVTWTATGGTVSNTGLYTAPNTAGTYTVRVTSVEDPSFGAEARVTVSNTLLISPNIVQIGTSEKLQFTATLPGGATADVTWTASRGTISSTGLFTAPDSSGAVTITATLKSDPNRKATVTIGVNTISVAIDPTTATVERGGAFDFDATVTGATTSNAVTWTTSAGTIDANGLFTAPTTGTTVTVRATSVADPSRSATATVTLTAALPNVTVTVGPSGIQLSPGGVADFAATVVGSTNTAVVWTATGGTIDEDGIFTAGTTTGTFAVRATSVANPNRSASVTIKIDPIPVNITPRSATVRSGNSVQFTATVGGAGASGGVTWTTTEGVIDANGLFSGTTPGTYTVTATSKTDTSKSNTATVTVTSAAG